MLTAVQLLESPTTSAQVTFGVPIRFVEGTSGRIALFEAGALVAYTVRRDRRFSFFLFRSQATDEAGALVVGVRPSVKLLLATNRRGIAKNAGKLLTWLATTPHVVPELSDAFWFRAVTIVVDKWRRPGGFDPSTIPFG